MINSSDKNTIISILKAYNPKLIGVFGSYARNQQTATSDLDILIELSKKITLFDLIGLEQTLSEQLGIKVDLVTKGALNNNTLKKNIEKDLVVIYE